MRFDMHSHINCKRSKHLTRKKQKCKQHNNKSWQQFKMNVTTSLLKYLSHHFNVGLFTIQPNMNNDEHESQCDILNWTFLMFFLCLIWIKFYFVQFPFKSQITFSRFFIQILFELCYTNEILHVDCYNIHIIKKYYSIDSIVCNWIHQLVHMCSCICVE